MQMYFFFLLLNKLIKLFREYYLRMLINLNHSIKEFALIFSLISYYQLCHILLTYLYINSIFYCNLFTMSFTIMTKFTLFIKFIIDISLFFFAFFLNIFQTSIHYLIKI